MRDRRFFANAEGSVQPVGARSANPAHLASLAEHGPSSLATDSQSARDVSYNPQHHDRMKHVQRRHFFVRDMVESFELEVPFVRTADNIADMFTKCMKNPNDFHKLRRIAMNEA